MSKTVTGHEPRNIKEATVADGAVAQIVAMRCRLSMWWDIISGISLKILVTSCKHSFFFLIALGVHCARCGALSLTKLVSGLPRYRTKLSTCVWFVSFLAYRHSTQPYTLGIPVERQILQCKVLLASPYFCKLLWCACVCLLVCALMYQRVHVFLTYTYMCTTEILEIRANNNIHIEPAGAG